MEALLKLRKHPMVSCVMFIATLATIYTEILAHVTVRHAPEYRPLLPVQYICDHGDLILKAKLALGRQRGCSFADDPNDAGMVERQKKALQLLPYMLISVLAVVPSLKQDEQKGL